MSIDENLEVTSCRRCPKLVECRSQIVNGRGPTDADVMIVGEAPGANEDEQGEPFVGRSGKLLEEIIEKYQGEKSVRITNCVRCRPPDNRDPTDEELENCSEYLSEEISEVQPEVIVCVGSVPSQELIGIDVAVTKEIGDTYTREFNNYRTTVMVAVHPAFVLRDGRYRDDLEEAIQKAFDGCDVEDESLDEYF